MFQKIYFYFTFFNLYLKKKNHSSHLFTSFYLTHNLTIHQTTMTLYFIFSRPKTQREPGIWNIYTKTKQPTAVCFSSSLLLLLLLLLLTRARQKTLNTVLLAAMKAANHRRIVKKGKYLVLVVAVVFVIWIFFVLFLLFRVYLNF